MESMDIKTMKIRILLLALALSGCVTPSTVLVNSKGQMARCSSAGGGYGIMGAVSIGMAQQSHDQCVKDAKLMGYVPMNSAVQIGIAANADRKIEQVTPSAAAAGVKVN